MKWYHDASRCCPPLIPHPVLPYARWISSHVSRDHHLGHYHPLVTPKSFKFQTQALPKLKIPSTRIPARIPTKSRRIHRRVINSHKIPQPLIRIHIPRIYITLLARIHITLLTRIYIAHLTRINILCRITALNVRVASILLVSTMATTMATTMPAAVPPTVALSRFVALAEECPEHGGAYRRPGSGAQ